MIQIAVLAYFRGCNPASPWPIAVLELKASRHDLQRLFHKPVLQRLRDLLRELPESEPFLLSFAEGEESNRHDGVEPSSPLAGQLPSDSPGEFAPDQGQVPDVTRWLLSWVDAMQVRSGRLRIEKPRRLPTPPAAGVAADGDGFLMRIQVDLLGAPLQEVLSGLEWSASLWQWALTDGPRSRRRELLAKAPVSRPRPKASLTAMVRSAIDLPLDWSIESFSWSTPMLVIGRGCGLRRVSQKVTDLTSGWGMSHSKQKLTAAWLLSEAGLPVAGGGQVDTLRQAVAMAERLGYPVVTKPANEDQGRGVVTNIQSREDLLKAFRRSESAGTPVLLQSHVSGRDFRFYVVNGRLLAALERIPAQVCGDGRSNVRQLVEAENEFRHKHPVCVEGGEEIHYCSINLDLEAKHLLTSQGLTSDSTPRQDQVVRLSPTPNFSMGGTVRDCLAEVHPDNRRLIEKVARIFRLDIAGIDVIASAIDVPIHQSGGVICEVNGMPGVLPHQLAETSRHLMAETLTLLLEKTEQPPLIAVYADHDLAPVMSALELELAALFPGLAVLDRQGWRQGGVVWSGGDARAFLSQRRALRDPDAEAFLIELDAKSLVMDGLAWKRADVLVLLDDQPSLPSGWCQWLATRAAVVVATPGICQGLPASLPAVSFSAPEDVPAAVLAPLRQRAVVN